MKDSLQWAKDPHRNCESLCVLRGWSTATPLDDFAGALLQEFLELFATELAVTKDLHGSAAKSCSYRYALNAYEIDGIRRFPLHLKAKFKSLANAFHQFIKRLRLRMAAGQLGDRGDTIGRQSPFR